MTYAASSSEAGRASSTPVDGGMSSTRTCSAADGTCAVDYNKFSEPDETFKIDTGVKSGLFKRFKYTFKGYSDLDAAFNRIVASQNDHYTYTADVKE